MSIVRDHIKPAIIRHGIAFAEKVGGGRFRIVRPTHMFEIWEQEQLKKFIDHFEVDCIFDVGANRGQYATMLREKVGFRGLIISFEPDPDCVAVLRNLSKTDPLWQIEEAVLSDEPEVDVNFHLMVSNQCNSLLAPSTEETDVGKAWNKIKKTIALRTKTIEEAFGRYKERYNFGRPFLKMDTQGNDVNVARGAKSTLSSFVGIQSELAIKRLYSNAPGYVEAIRFYEANGFSLSAFVPNNAGHFPRLIETDCIMFNERFFNT